MAELNSRVGKGFNHFSIIVSAAEIEINFLFHKNKRIHKITRVGRISVNQMASGNQTIFLFKSNIVLLRFFLSWTFNYREKREKHTGNATGNATYMSKDLIFKRKPIDLKIENK